MKVKTIEAKGRQLDWSLAKAMGHVVELGHGGQVCVQNGDAWRVFDHTEPFLCQLLISNCVSALEKTELSSREKMWWSAWISDSICGHGETVEQAVARCCIKAKFGDEFECPDELEGV